MSIEEATRRSFIKSSAAFVSGALAIWPSKGVAQTTKTEPIAKSGLIIYPAPMGEILSTDYLLEINGKPVPVYVIKSQWHDKKYSAAYFDFAGSVTVKVTPNPEKLKITARLEGLAIRPSKYGIQHTTAMGAITFTIDRPFNVSIEPSGQNSPLHLFGNPIEVNPPRQGDPNVIYFGPGIHKPTRIDLTAGQTLYIAGGAVVKSAVTSVGDNIRIMGRGILCGNDWEHSKGPTDRMVWPADGTNILLEDIIIRGAWNWTVAPSRCDQVLIRNLRICGSRCGNDDGIDPCNSSNVTIRNCFVHTDDDGIAVKGTARAGQNPKSAENILVEDCTFWIDFANGFRIGYESRATAMRNFTARNIDIIHFPNRPQVCVFLLQPHSNMPMENLVFEDIRINGEQPLKLVQMTPLGNVEAGKGLAPAPSIATHGFGGMVVPGNGPYIHNVTFKDVTVYGQHDGPDLTPLIALEGVSEVHDIANVTFENLMLHGRKVTKDRDDIKIGQFVTQVNFLAEK